MKRILEGQWTSSIYTLISEKKYIEAVDLLQPQLEFFPNNRAALSLLSYCFYNLQNYPAASACYEKLVRAHPEVMDYKVNFAQSLYKAGNYVECAKAIVAVNDPQFTHRMLKLSAYIKYEQEDKAACKAYLEQCPFDDPDVGIVHGCLLYKDKKYEEARIKFTEALNSMGYKTSIAYNIALCYYQMKQYMQARKYIIDIITRGLNEHPELDGSNQEGVDARSVGNTLTLQETALIETFNLKAAIEYELKNFPLSKESLASMPPRSESELDPYTLHNIALMNMDDNPNEHLPKLNFLLECPQFPSPTFANILILYCKYGFYDVAADVLAEHSHLVDLYLNQVYNFSVVFLKKKDLHAFLEAFVIQQTAPEESFRKFDVLANRHIEQIRKITKQVQDSRMAHDDNELKAALKAYDEAVEKYIPVLTSQAKIYWDMENYPLVEKVFRSSIEFASEHEIWKLNVAHTFFMQDRFHDAIKYYEPIVKKYQDNLLSVKAIVLANLCSAYVMIGHNDEAEELMKKIEKEEEALQVQEPDKKIFHLCIINLAVGTLYCAQKNVDFGMGRIPKGIKPFEKMLDPDTWYYAKRCLLSGAESIAKQTAVIKDATHKDIISFLDQCDRFGKEIPAVIAPFSPQEMEVMEHATISQEARQLKAVFLNLRGEDL